MHLVALALLWVGAARAAPPDDRVRVTVLPVAGDHSLEPQVRAALEALPPFVVHVPLDEDATRTLNEQPDCRDRPACLESVLAEGVQVLVDARLEDRGPGAVATLRVVVPGDSATVSTFVTRSTAKGLVADFLLRELEPLRLEVRLYEAARQGKESAADRLRREYPASPWTQALDSREASPW